MIFLLLILGFLIRLISLNQSLWLDEAITALAIKNNSFIGLIISFAPGDFHPPLYYLFLKLWTNFFGYSEIALRFPSIIFSLGTGVFIFLIGKKKIGLIGMFLWMINPLAVYYAQEARMYSLAAFAVAGAMYFFLQKKWLWYVVFFAIAVWSDYLPLLMLPVFFLLGSDKKRFLALLPFLILLPLFLIQLQNGFAVSTTSWASVLGRFDLKALPLTFVKFTFGRIPTEIWMAPVLLVYTFVLARAKSKVSWSWLIVPVALGFLMSAVLPIYSYFRFLFVLPAFVLLLVKGSAKNIVIIPLITLMSLIPLMYFNLNPEFQREDWRAAVAYIQSDPGVVVFPNTAQSAPLEYYGTSLDNPNKNTVYLMRYVQEIFDPTDFLRASLEARNYKKTEEKGFNGVLIWKYKKQF